MSHTPGPWAVVGGPSKYNQVYAEGAKTSETSAFLTGWITPANAHLIAAAPLLLEAAEELANAIEKQLAMTGKGITPSPRVAAALESARTAINAAKGNQQ